ncbi:hypothetical protein D3C84_723580 [compost metagenome]
MQHQPEICFANRSPCLRRVDQIRFQSAVRLRLCGCWQGLLRLRFAGLQLRTGVEPLVTVLARHGGRQVWLIGADRHGQEALYLGPRRIQGSGIEGEANTHAQGAAKYRDRQSGIASTTHAGSRHSHLDGGAELHGIRETDADGEALEPEIDLHPGADPEGQ